MSGEQGWSPAFPGQRPPFKPGNEHAFEPGNEEAVQHGARSERRLRPVAERWLERLAAAARSAGLHDDVDDVARERLAWTLARAELLERYLDEQGFEDDRGELRPAVRELGKLDSSVRNQLRDLGFNPAARAAIGLDLAQARNAISEAELRELVVAIFQAVAEVVEDRALARAVGDRVQAIVEAHPLAGSALPSAGEDGAA